MASWDAVVTGDGASQTRFEAQELAASGIRCGAACLSKEGDSKALCGVIRAEVPAHRRTDIGNAPIDALRGSP